MGLPFTTEQFLDVMGRYNEAVWPAQWGLYLLGVCAVALAVRAGTAGGRAVAAILATLWAWMGIAYHLAFFRAINPAAVAFGAAFVAQGALFLWLGVRHDRLTFRVRGDLPGTVGALLALYALAGYPALAYALGHRWPATPTFGLPCPTTILTLALLAWASPPAPRLLLVVPLAWAAVATSAAVQLGMGEDFGLTAAAVLVVAALALGGRGAVRAAPSGAAHRPTLAGGKP